MTRDSYPRQLTVAFVGVLLAAVLLGAGCAGDGPADGADPQLAEMLTEATALDPADERAVELIEAIVAELNSANSAPLVPAGQRSQVAHALAPFIADINIVFQPEQTGGLPAQRDAWSPADQPNSVAIHQAELRAILADLGLDPQATETLLTAQNNYYPSALTHYLSDQQRNPDDRLADAQLAAAANTDVITGLLDGALGPHATVANTHAAHTGLQGQSAAFQALVAEPVAPSTAPGDERLVELFHEHRATPLVDLDQGSLDIIYLSVKNVGRSNVEMAIPLALYASVDLDDPAYDELLPELPTILREAKQEQRPWTQQEVALWDTYLGEHTSLAVVAREASSYYLQRLPPSP